MKINKFNSLAIFTLFLLISLGCNFSVKSNYYKDDLKLSEPKAENLIELYNKKDITKIYEDFHPQIKIKQTEEDFDKIINQMHEKYGRLDDKVLVYSKVKLFGAKERISHFLYKAKYEKSEHILHISVITNDDKETLTYGFNNYETDDAGELITELERNK